MTGRKYSRIIQSARYYAAIDNYLKYITDSTKKGKNVGNGTARPPSQVLYVNPFAINLVAKQFAKVSGASPTWQSYATDMAGYAKAVLGSDEEACDIDNFRPARIIIKTGITTTKKIETSAVTGMKYISYGGKSTSLPFGRRLDTESESDAFTALRDKIFPKLTAASSRVTWSKEKV